MKYINNNSGQALVTLLVFMAVAITVTSASIIMSIENIRATANLASGNEALRVAEAGVDEAIIRLLRNPNYTGGNITVGDGTATITITGTTTKSIVSEGTLGIYKRKISATGTMTNNVLTITGWNEIP